jgi:hypothetical protein
MNGQRQHGHGCPVVSAGWARVRQALPQEPSGETKKEPSPATHDVIVLRQDPSTLIRLRAIVTIIGPCCTSSPLFGPPALLPSAEFRVVNVIGRSSVVTYTLPPATAMFDRTPPSDPGEIVYGSLIVSWCASASAESLSCPLCSPTGVFHMSARPCVQRVDEFHFAAGNYRRDRGRRDDALAAVDPRAREAQQVARRRHEAAAGAREGGRDAPPAADRRVEDDQFCSPGRKARWQAPGRGHECGVAHPHRVESQGVVYGG